MSGPLRALVGLLTLFAALLLVGCRAEETLPLPHWVLVGEGGVELPVTIPVHLDRALPDRETTYLLRTRVVLPEPWRGKTLTLAIPQLEAPTALRVDGATASALEDNVAPGRPSLSAHAFRIYGTQTSAAVLELELVIERRHLRAAWLDTMPRLSATVRGDRTFLAVRTLNGSVSVATFAVISTVGFTYLALYFFDRRRSLHLLFALQAMGVSNYVLERLGIPQTILGLDSLSPWFIVASGVAGVHFTYAYFGLGKPSKWFFALPAAMLVLAAMFHGRFEARVPTIVSGFVSLSLVALQARLLLRAYREGRDRFSAAMLLTAYAFVALTSIPDVRYVSGFGEIAGGAHTLVLGLGVYSVIQSIVLGRDHARSLSQSDTLNVELAQRVTLLEARDKENLVLTDELRRQIADRSRRFAEALARIGAVPERVVSLKAGDMVHERYRTIRRLGEGGMGAVYEVERLADARRLALKVLTGASTGAALARLAREAQVAAEVSHENLVAIVDVDVSETGALFLVMELIDGAPLHEARDRYGDLAWVRSTLLQVARGLAALHARGIVHRDLKPGNVLLTRDGVAKIADFGIARLDDASETPDPLAPTVASTEPSDPAIASTIEHASAALTGTGVLMGTPLYMAPELARGARSALASSDIWSFGVIAYELASGRHPFPTPAVLDALAGRAVAAPPALDAPGIDTILSTLITRCLAREPAERPTAAEIVMVLGASVVAGNS